MPSNFKFDFIEEHLSDYPDKLIVDLLKYGFPLGNVTNSSSHRVPKNHKGASEFPKQIETILQRELDTRAAIGPFKRSPIPYACFSPLNSVPKKDSSDRRLILDLSHPPGSSINDGISKDEYLDYKFKLELPSVDALAARIITLGPGCKVFKIDLTRGYRQMKMDPGDIHWLGYTFHGRVYFDVSLSMGSVSSARCCQLVTSAVVYVYNKFGFFAINYLDDIGSAERDDTADLAYQKLHELINNFGLEAALAKCCAPCYQMTFLGIEVNTLLMTLSIPKDKWEEIRKTLLEWNLKDTASLKETQSLAGLLNFACKCVQSGRVYLSRILNFLRTFKRGESKEVPQNVRDDVQWWLQFAKKFNRVSLIQEVDFSNPDVIIGSDSCLTGGGCFSHGEYCH